ncbi:MAG: sulfatase-like hydrolase/transferase [Bradymonadales bacterium]
MKHAILQSFFCLLLLIACKPTENAQNSQTAENAENNNASHICQPLPNDADSSALLENLVNPQAAWHFWRNAMIINLGSQEAVKYQQGLYNSTWQNGELISRELAQNDKVEWLAERWVAWNIGSTALLRFPLPARETKENERWLATIRLRPKINRQMDLRLNTHGTIASVPLNGSWETIKVIIDADKLKFGGENTINFMFTGSYFEGENRVAAKFDYFALTPYDENTRIRSNNDPALDPPVEELSLKTARILDQSKEAYSLVYGDEMHLYRILPANVELNLVLGPGAWLQREATFRVDILTDEGMLYPVYTHELKAGDCWQKLKLNLSQWANTAVRLRLSVGADEDSPIAWPSDRGVAYVADIKFKSLQNNDRLSQYCKKIRDKAKNIVIINIDGLRADRVHAPNQNRASAALQALASRGLRGTALGEGSGSLLSTVSLLYGVSARKHGVIDTKTHVRNSLHSLAELFQEAGWQTHFYSNNAFIDPKLGYAQGFRTVHDLLAEGLGSNTKAALELVLRAMQQTTMPSLYYVHLSQLRLPYSASDEQLKRFGVKNYQGPIDLQAMMNLAQLSNYQQNDALQLAAYYDSSLERLVNDVSEFIDKLEEDSLLLITGSHGVSLGEDSLLGYNNSLSPAELLIPYIFTMKSVNESYYIPEIVRIYDIYATLAQIMGFDCKDCDGVSVVETLSQDLKTLALSETHRASATGPYFYLLRDGDNDTLSQWSWENMKSIQDLRRTQPIAHRAMRDRMFSQ